MTATPQPKSSAAGAPMRRPQLHGHGGFRFGRPFPGACRQQRSLMAVIEDLTDAVMGLTAALVGSDPAQEALEELHLADGAPQQTLCSLPLQQEPQSQALAHGALTAEEEARIVAEATELWDTPWHNLSVAELRALLRDLPIDRTALPAPIEFLRRQELLEALLTLPAISW